MAQRSGARRGGRASISTRATSSRPVPERGSSGCAGTDETGSYSVGSDATLMAVLERESSALSDPGLKELAESMISKMRVPDNANGQ
jgi:hypothetical protein